MTESQPSDPLGQVMALGGESNAQIGVQSAPYISAILVECQHGSLPFAQANAAKLISTLREKMNLTPSQSLSQFLERVGDLQNLTLKQLDNLIPVSVTFEDGSIKLDRKGKTDVIQVSGIALKEPSSMNVHVFGTSDDAEEALGKLYESLCSAAGLTRSWSEGRKSVGFKQHSTMSLETLNCGIETLLAPNVASAFKNNFKNHKTLLSRLGSLPIDPDTEQPFEKTYIGSVKLAELSIMVTRIDPESGSTDANRLAIQPHSKIDAGRGTYAVTSALPYDEHNKFVVALKSALEG